MKARRRPRRAFAFPVLALAAAVTLSGCDRPKPRTPKPIPAPIFPTPHPQAPQGPPMPALPAWSKDLIGQPIARLFPGQHPLCVGNIDNLQARYGGTAPGVQIVGWGWDAEAKAPIARVLLTDAAGVVAGAGESGLRRKDVPKARPDVTSPDTGWAALTERTVGPVEAYGVVGGGKALCRLGHLAF